MSPRPTFDGKTELKRLQRQQTMEFNKHGGAFGDNYHRQKAIDRLVVGLDGPKTGFYGLQANPLTGGRTSVLTNEGDRSGNYIFKNGSWQQNQSGGAGAQVRSSEYLNAGNQNPIQSNNTSQQALPGQSPNYERGRKRKGLAALRMM